jgi:acyl-CoA dehydrogenase
MDPFLQDPPRLGNQYDDDGVLRSYLGRTLPPGVLAEIEPSLREMGRLSGEVLYPMQLADLDHEPRLVRWDAWGHRVDRLEHTPLWLEAERIAAEHGVVATAYERAHGALSRVHQFALAYLFTPSTDIYACPLAMTDGAARTLLDSGNEPLVRRIVPRLLSRDPAAFWTSGQWMTETTGGSDVGRSETVARREEGVWRLYGLKWFTSATASQVALTLARPEGNPPGGKGLALFHVETRDDAGRLQGIRVRRLKDKLGTRKLPTAELELEGTPAVLVGADSDGVRAITPVLNLTRTWNAVSAVALMRRGIALARDFAGRRVAFGAPLSRQPLFVDTLAGMQAELEGAFQLTFRNVELVGRAEAGELDAEERRLLRALTPLAKLTTGRQAVAVASEVVEAFGGAGYLEDTGIPMLLRDSQVLTIWEGTTDVLALETLRALGSSGVAPVRAEMERALAGVRSPELEGCVSAARDAADRAERWLDSAARAGRHVLEAGARRFALTLGRTLELALLCEQAQWSQEHEADGRAGAAARRLLAHGVDRLAPPADADSGLLSRG